MTQLLKVNYSQEWEDMGFEEVYVNMILLLWILKFYCWLLYKNIFVRTQLRRLLKELAIGIMHWIHCWSPLCAGCFILLLNDSNHFYAIHYCPQNTAANSNLQTNSRIMKRDSKWVLRTVWDLRTTYQRFNVLQCDQAVQVCTRVECNQGQ